MANQEKTQAAQQAAPAKDAAQGGKPPRKYYRRPQSKKKADPAKEQPAASAAPAPDKAAEKAPEGPQPKKRGPGRPRKEQPAPATQAAGQEQAPSQQKKAPGAKEKPAGQKNAPAQKGGAGKKNTAGQKNNAAPKGGPRSTAAAGEGGQKRRRAPGKGKKTAVQDTAVPMRIIPLGGLGEVGKNVTLYECLGDMVMVDCGAIFPDDDMFGVDLVIPDFTYVVQNKDKIKGIFITHGHEDHIGALPYLLRQVNLPIYGTRLTLGLIENKLREHGLLQSTKLIPILPGDKIHLGCLVVEPIHVNHSIPDAVAYAIDSPAGVAIATGDYKIDYTPIACGVTDLSKFAEYGKKGVLALLADSTNSERPGFSRSERTVGASFAGLFSRAGNKRIIIATFASNLYRIQQILDMAAQYGRKVAVYGRSMVNNTNMAFELGYLHAPEGLVIDVDSINKYPPEKVVLVTTGSQGEPLAALSRMAAGLHRSVRVGAGDFIIISATPIPGNEKGVSKVVNGLMMLGAEVIYESMYDVHVSGHAYQDEQKLMLSLVKPQYFIPVHGEFKHLKKHAMLAEGVGVPKENVIIAKTGDVLRLTQNSAVIESEVTAGQVFVDGLGVGDVGSVVLRDRQLLSEDGLVIVSAAVDTATGEVVSGPEIVSRGFVYVKESEQLMREARTVVKNVFARCKREEYLKDMNGVRARVRDQISQFIYRKTKRSPMILPIIMEV